MISLGYSLCLSFLSYSFSTPNKIKLTSQLYKITVIKSQEVLQLCLECLHVLTATCKEIVIAKNRPRNCWESFLL